MTDKEIVFDSIIKAENNLLGLNRYMSVETFLDKIIFSHDFAKAFWGDKNYLDPDRAYYIPAWKHHLQQIVLEEKPLKYLEKFLK